MTCLMLCPTLLGAAGCCNINAHNVAFFLLIDWQMANIN